MIGKQLLRRDRPIHSRGRREEDPTVRLKTLRFVYVAYCPLIVPVEDCAKVIEDVAVFIETLLACKDDRSSYTWV